MASEGVSVMFDDECRVRVLDPEQFKSTEQLQSECQAFVSSTLCVCVCEIAMEEMADRLIGKT